MANEGNRLLDWTQTHFPEILRSDPESLAVWSNFISAFTVAPEYRERDNWLGLVIPRTIELGLTIQRQNGASIELLMSAISYSLSLAETAIKTETKDKILMTIEEGLKNGPDL